MCRREDGILPLHRALYNVNTLLSCMYLRPMHQVDSTDRFAQTRTSISRCPDQPTLPCRDVPELIFCSSSPDTPATAAIDLVHEVRPDED
uniref:Uncharacterized protein n=1 Tax=Aegilops tauschii subsp. strangulata TaxID=200361 RepID=A0A453QYJ8_AEGTS